MDTYKKMILDSDELCDKASKIGNVVCDVDKHFPIIIDYMYTFSNLHELYQLLQLFNFSYGGIKEIYSHPNNNIVAINAYTMSLISLGKMIEDMLKDNAKDILGEADSKCSEFVKCTNKEYDDNFSFRFLIKLRDYSQHGYIPVSYQDNCYCFDLDQIINPPFFTHKKPIMEEMKAIIISIKEKYKDTATLSYRFTVSSYVCSIYRIFKVFMENVFDAISEKNNQMLQLAKENPIWFSHNYSELDGLMCFSLSENPHAVHFLSLEDKPMEEYDRELKAVSERLNYEINDLDEYNKKFCRFDER